MKDKELRRITYDSFNELDSKIDYIYNQLKRLEQNEKIDLSLDHGCYDNPFSRLTNPPINHKWLELF